MTMAGDGALQVAEASDDEHGARIAALMDDVRAGRAEAINGLVTEFTPMLWQVARAAGLSGSDSEDVVQTVWESLLTHLDTIHTPAALTGWLVTTAKRESWRVRKADRRQSPADPETLISIPEHGGGSEDHVIMADELRQLRSAFLTLDPRCQELLRIVASVHRPDYSQVAGRMGMARGSVGPTRGRCLDKLRTALSQGGGERWS
jgi:RNA polymerase sigma factor (sigma-70 family)